MLSAASALTIALAIASAPNASQAAPTPEPADRPFAHLLSNLVRDIAALPSRRTAAVLGVGTGAALFVHPVDDNLADWARTAGPTGYTRLGDVLGNGWIQAGGAVATYAIGVARGHRETAHVGADLIRGQLLTGLITRGLKIGIGRRRPSGGGHAMPSGHASAAFVSAAVLDGHFGWRAGGPAYAAAGFIAWTRVRDVQHWLSDVVIGGAIGVVVGRTIAAGHRERSWAVVPTATANSVAVYFVKR